MANLTSSLTVKLIDDASKPARTVAQTLRDAEKEARDVAKGMAGTGATDRFIKSLSGLKATRQDIEQVAAAWRDYSKSAGLAANSAQWTKKQAADMASAASVDSGMSSSAPSVFRDAENSIRAIAVVKPGSRSITNDDNGPRLSESALYPNVRVRAMTGN
jgi:hypothetical protein